MLDANDTRASHHVSVGDPTNIPVTQEVRLERRQQRDLPIDLLSEWSPREEGPKQRAAVGVAYAMGAAGILAGTITGVDALVKNAELEARCDATGAFGRFELQGRF